MKLTGGDIRKQDFPRKMRGYDTLDVNAFLQFVADEMDHLNAANEELSEKCAQLSRKVSKMVGREGRIEKSLQAVTAFREETQSQSGQLLENSKAEAERVVTQAEEDASRIRQESEWNSRRLKDEVAALDKLRERTVQNLAEVLHMQTRLLENEADRLGIEIPKISDDEGAKVVPIKHKAESKGK